MSPSNNTTIQRLLLLKIASEADQDRVISLFTEIPAKARRDGKPYILNMRGGTASSTSFSQEARTQGYTVAMVTEFASEDDVRFWDAECVAHAELKKIAMPLQQGAMVMHWTNQIAV
ncbi:stress responsive A/B barrel domain-containing protein [Microdochium trichocladiopsis]|uniref:Stress responsive A/B barrel domain-containing protein n=1 Tax=Microdochium trichocladiopsis TaxID=1682393 RepID=A0A9P8XXR1_9PEZI|nr:stress responsive A/B barrel domain-containing protein [Microdochium trichocladiopsis]KAH7024514.1 stress responsive A/B barrel domain-containing protein [Microdochium trichocladiopsis]